MTAGSKISFVARPLAGVVALIVLVVSGLTLPAQAAVDGAALDRYRAAGVIIERFDGLTELANSGSAPAEAKALVAEVNAQRTAVYQKRAAENGVPVSELAKIYAREIFQNAPSGTIFKDAAGKTMKKP